VLAGVAVAVVAVAVPLVLADANHTGHVLRTVGEPTSLSVAPTTPADTAPAATSLPPGTAPAVTAPGVTGPGVTGPAGSTTPTVPRTTTTRNPVVVKECATSQLNASLTNPSGAAGSVGYDVSFVNVSAVSCSLRGYPGVSYVTGANGTTVGAPAQRDNFGPIVTVILAPGHGARATLIEINSANFPPDTCRAVPVSGLRIYPPNQTAALFVAQAVQACSNPADPVLGIRPIQAAAGG
jgi:hypothetical protein